MLVVGEVTPEPLVQPHVQSPDSETFKEIRERGFLKVIVNSYTPSLAFREQEGGPITGYEIDLIATLGKRIFGHSFDLAENAQLIEAANGEKIDLLDQREADLIIANLTDTPTRRERIHMCGHYISDRETPLRGPGAPDISSIDELTGITVAVESDTSTLEMLAQAAPKAEIVEAPTANDWLGMLNSGRAQLYIGDTIYNSGLEKQTGGALRRSSLRFRTAHAAVGVAKNREDMRDFVNISIAELLSSGQLQAMRRRWQLL